MHREAVKFLLVYGVAGATNYALSLFLIWLGVQYLLAKALAIGIIMFFNYGMLQGFVFRN